MGFLHRIIIECSSHGFRVMDSQYIAKFWVQYFECYSLTAMRKLQILVVGNAKIDLSQFTRLVYVQILPCEEWIFCSSLLG